MLYRTAINGYKKAIRGEIRDVWQRIMEGTKTIHKYRLLIKQLRILAKLDVLVPTRKIEVQQELSLLQQIPIHYELTK